MWRKSFDAQVSELEEIRLEADVRHRRQAVRARLLDDRRAHLGRDGGRCGRRRHIDPHLDEVHALLGEPEHQSARLLRGLGAVDRTPWREAVVLMREPETGGVQPRPGNPARARVEGERHLVGRVAADAARRGDAEVELRAVLPRRPFRLAFVVRVRLDEPGNDCLAGPVDDLGPGGNRGLGPRPGRRDAVAPYHDDRVDNRVGAGAVDELSTDDRQRARLTRRLAGRIRACTAARRGGNENPGHRQSRPLRYH